MKFMNPNNLNTKLLSLFGVLLSLLLLTSCNKQSFSISTDVDDYFHVQNQDYEIPVWVKGNTSSKKIILFIEGGPGANSMDFATIDFGQWEATLEQDYAIAYYDQRGTGNHQGNFDQGEVILDTWVSDLHAVAAFLKVAYDAEIIMYGWSFGGGLMYRYILEKGDDAIPVKYISSDAPVTTDAESDTLRWKFRREFLYNTALLEISRNNNVGEWEEVLDWLALHQEIIELEGDDQYLLFDQWNEYIETLVYKYYPGYSPDVHDFMSVIFNSPYNPITAYLYSNYNDDLVTAILQEEEDFQLMQQLNKIDSESILIITGRYDDICPPEELQYIYDQISSPNKQMQIIDYAGHEVFTAQPTIFYDIVKSFIQ